MSGITGVEEPDPQTGKRPSVYVNEHAPWSAVRNAAHSYGFAAFSVDPGSQRGGMTTIKVTYYDVVGTGVSWSPSKSSRCAVTATTKLLFCQCSVAQRLSSSIPWTERVGPCRCHAALARQPHGNRSCVADGGRRKTH